MGTPREINAMAEEVPGDEPVPLSGTLSAPPASLLAIDTVPVRTPVAVGATVILDGVAASETVGTAGGVTETVVDTWEEPVAPVQVSA